MLLYFTLINHVALPPLNNLRAHGPQWRSTLVGVLPGVLVLVALARGSELAVLLAASWLWVWLALQIRQWWVPYLFGSTALHRDLGWYAAGGYDRTARVLPRAAHRPAPDLQHLVLEALSLLAAVATTLTASAR